MRTYADEGKSGLNIGGRLALQQLIKDVESGSTDFQMVLVYDVSRWGRFQDADESAYYEYICRRAGIHVTYVAEQFENDGSPVSTIVKGVKRAMAGEYSRELSAKVFAGQCRLIELGYRQGGPAGYGLRRVLIDQSGSVKSELTRGEHKSLQTDRVILMPGPDSEVQTVNQIYKWFIDGGIPESEIAARLNGQGIRTDLDRDWTRSTVREVLSNEKYIGNNVYNRISFKLKKHRITNQPDMWIKKEGAFEAIVPPEVFYMDQGIIRARAHRFSSEELIEKLRNLYQHRGFLSGLIIDEAEGMPSAAAYIHRFGSLIRAYEAVGFTPDRDYQFLEVNKFLRKLHPEIIGQTERAIAQLGGTVVWDPATDLLTVNREFSISVVLARCTASCCAAGCRRPGWRNVRRWWQAGADIRAALTRRRKAVFLCLSLSRSRRLEQAKKQTDGPQTRANTRLRVLNAQEGSREQREKNGGIRAWNGDFRRSVLKRQGPGNRANTGGTGKKIPTG